MPVPATVVMIPVASVQEMNDQIQWFAEDVIGKAGA